MIPPAPQLSCVRKETGAPLVIALDATYSVGENLSGVGVYSRETIHGVAAHWPRDGFLLAYRPHRFLRALRTPIPGNCRRRLLWEKRPLRSAALFHGLNQRLPAVRYPRMASTFHDLFVLSGDYSSPEFRERFARQAREAAVRSDLIITVSRFTAGQVSDLLGIPPSRLRVIPHGVHPPASPPQGPREPLILHVGALQKRKNVVRLVKAFEALPAEWRLALAGSAGYGAAEILEAIGCSPARDRIKVLGYVSDDALKSLFARASLLAFPSLDEGFGIPILEAMAWGVPVLTSARSAMPEAAGDAALYVDPGDTNDIAAGLLRLIDDRELRDTLVRRGSERIREFSWEAAARKTTAVYAELLS